MKYQAPQNIKLIIGLGNPLPQYDFTYHNAGFLFVNHIAKIPNLKSQIPNKFQIQNSKNFQFLKINGISLIKPLTFMNESGRAISAAIKYFKIKPEEILIVHDDSDIEIGKYKISFGRGSAGHNGVESIIKSLKTKDFWRLRIGIRPNIRINQSKISINQRLKASAFVLKKISKKDLKILEDVFKETAQKI